MTNTTTAPLTRVVNGATLPAPGTFGFDASHTTIGFSVRHMMVAKVRGTFGEFAGSLTVADEITDSTVEMTIQAASFSTGDANRDAHVKSADFLEVETYPTLAFKSTSIKPAGGNRYKVTGDFTVRDVTRPLTLDVEFEGVVQDPYGNQRIGFSATGEINREEFGVKFNAALETGGVVVSSTVKLEIEAEAVRQA